MSSSPQRNHLKENISQNNNSSTEDYLSIGLLNKICQIKGQTDDNNQQEQLNFNQNLKEEDNLEANNKTKNQSEEMLQQQTQQQTTTPFEIMKHCGLVDELNIYDQYDGQHQLDSSSASSKTEEMPISSPNRNSPQLNCNSSPPNVVSPVNSDTGSRCTSVNNNNDPNQLNTSHNSGGCASSCSTNLNNNNNLNEHLTNQIHNNNQQTSGLNVNLLLNSVNNAVANSLANNSTTNTSPSQSIAAQQQANNSPNTNSSNLLSELSVLMAAAANNQNSNLPNNQANNNNSTNGNLNANPLAGLNGLNLLNTLTNSLPINQIATLLAGSGTNNSTVNQQQLLLQQATSLGKLPGFNLNSANDLQEQLQQLQQQQFQQQLQQIQQFLFLNQLNQQSNLSNLSSIAPLLPQNLQTILQSSNLLGAQNLMNTPINQQTSSQHQQNNRPDSASGTNNTANNNLNLPQLLQQLQEAQVLQTANVGNNQSAATNLLNGTGLLSNLTSNLNTNQNVSNLLQHPLNNSNSNNNNPLIKKERGSGVDLSTLNSLSQHLLAKNSQSQNSSSLNGTNQNTVAAALANLQNSPMDCDNNTVFNKLAAAAANQIKSNNAFQNNTVANALLQQQKSALQLNNTNQQNTNNLIVNVQQQLRHLQQTQQQPNLGAHVKQQLEKQLSPQFENNSNHSNFSNSSSTNSKTVNTSLANNGGSSSRLSNHSLKLENNNDPTLNSVLNNHQNNGGQGNAGEDVKELEELEQFAKYFKQKRIKMGFTQGDVGQAMGRNYGNDFSQTTISRFEALNLSFKNMLKLKPMLERWLHDTDMAGTNGSALNVNNLTNGQTHTTLLTNQPLVQNNCVSSLISPGIESMCKRRKKRTSIETGSRVFLEKAFLLNQKPTFEEIAELADKLNMEKEVVRVWFCNRRQKQRRTYPGEGDPQNLYNCYDFNETSNPNLNSQSQQLHQRLANQFENLNRSNIALRSPSPLSASNQFTAVSPGSPSDSELMNVDHSLPASPVSSRKYSIRQDSFS